MVFLVCFVIVSLETRELSPIMWHCRARLRKKATVSSGSSSSGAGTTNVFLALKSASASCTTLNIVRDMVCIGARTCPGRLSNDGKLVLMLLSDINFAVRLHCHRWSCESFFSWTLKTQLYTCGGSLSAAAALWRALLRTWGWSEK